MSNNIIRLLSKLSHPGDSLGQRASRAVVWIFAIRVLSRIFYFVRLVVLARLLAPDDLGLMGIAMLVMMGLDSFTPMGFDTALVQKKSEVREYLDVAWTVNGLRGLVLCLILIGASPFIGRFFETPAVEPMVRVIGISLLLQGWSSMGIMYFHKELEFKKQFYYEVGGTFVDFIVTIGLVLILGSVWALVFGLLAGNATRFVLSFALHPYRPHFSLDLAKMRELFGFGRWILLTSLIVFLISNGDDLIVGKILTVGALGLYQMAYRISNVPLTEITGVISNVAFPVYSKLQDNIPRLRETYLKVLTVVTLISAPLGGIIFILSREFTSVFLGDKWLPMVPAMQALAIFGFVVSFGAIRGPLFMGVGKPDVITKLSVAQLIIMSGLIFPLVINSDILGASITVLISVILMFPFAVYLEIKTINCSFWDYAKPVLVPVVATLIMVSVVYILKYFVFNNVNIFTFLFLAIAGVASYAGAILIYDRLSDNKIKIMFRSQLSQLIGGN